MKIGIDASRAFGKEKTGVETYSYQLTKALAMMDTSSHQIFLYVKNETPNFKLPLNFFIKKINAGKLWTQFGLSGELKINPVDVLFIPSYAVPIVHPRKTIVTIHGLEYKHCPDSYSAKEKLFLELNTSLSIKWSGAIIVPSENTKKDLVKFCKVNPQKIKVIYHGAGNKFKVQSSKFKVVRPTRESATYNKKGDEFNILSIERLERRKNIVNLIKAFEILNSTLHTPHSTFQIQDSKFQLILVGKKGFGFEEIEKAIQGSPFKKDIVLKNYVTEEEKDRLYKKADLFVFPSLYEGFGLPVLEAMSYGTPVVCSNVSSLPEIAGNAALLVNPNSAEEIAMAMSRVFSDADLRYKMIKGGFENAKRFSWEKCAKETMEVLLNC